MIVQISNLHKSFKDVKAVDDISFCVKEGELFAFLGVNGAGKSTTINIISGILNKDSGKVIICGEDIDKNISKIKNSIGIVFQNSVLDKKLSGYKNLKSRAALYGIFGTDFKNRLQEISDLLDLKDIIKKPLNKLSSGQKRRIDIARALIHNPKLLILDEPTTGLDPKTRITVWNVIDRLRKEQGLTVFLTTHYMEEASDSDYVVILDTGKIVAEGSPHDLKNKYAKDYIKFYNKKDEAKDYFVSLDKTIKQERDFVQVQIDGTYEVNKYFNDKPEIFDDFEVLKGNMDDVFLNVTGKNLKEV